MRFIFHWCTMTSLAILLDAIDNAYCLAAKAGEKDAARLLLMASLAISQKIETFGEPQALQTAQWVGLSWSRSLTTDSAVLR
jgi:hypothetical protein